MDAVAASLKEFGFRQPIVVDEYGVIVVGHTRWKAAQKLGLEKIPVHVATDLTPEQVRAYRIADNKTADLATWNLDLLATELTDLRAMDIGSGTPHPGPWWPIAARPNSFDTPWSTTAPAKLSSCSAALSEVSPPARRGSGMARSGHSATRRARRYAGTTPWPFAEFQAVFEVRQSGDLNCDGSFNGADIDPFFLALGDPGAYEVAFPNCDPLLGDMNSDGALNGGDIDPFFACLGGGVCP